MTSLRKKRMSGRDPHEPHRAATPLELLFDLTFVVAFSIAGNEFAHLVAEGHLASALPAFALAMFGVCWAWINFAWFASAYDTDDWVYRLLTLLQMVGVVVFALGIPDTFKSLDAGGLFDGQVIVAGYVIMRVAMVLQWSRVASHDPQRRQTALIYIVTLLLAQLVWLVITFIIPLTAATFVVAALLPLVIELSGPYFAERKNATPWHPHHIAERYSLLTIVALGEGVVGTVASVSSQIKAVGWNLDALLLSAAGIGLTFAMWWIYFAIPFGQLLHRHRARSFFWGYAHILVFASIAAMGAGLHTAGYFIEGKAHIGATATLLSVALPVVLYIVILRIIHVRLAGSHPTTHIWQLLTAAGLVIASIGVVQAGAPLVAGLLLLMLAPAVIAINVGETIPDVVAETLVKVD